MVHLKIFKATIVKFQVIPGFQGLLATLNGFSLHSLTFSIIKAEKKRVKTFFVPLVAFVFSGMFLQVFFAFELLFSSSQLLSFVVGPMKFQKS